MYLDKQRRIRRDIKTDNISLKKSGEVKLGDFDCTMELTNKDDLRRSIVGTPYWMAHEVIKTLYGVVILYVVMFYTYICVIILYSDIFFWNFVKLYDNLLSSSFCIFQLFRV